jgi:hypothetical protein
MLPDLLSLLQAIIFRPFQPALLSGSLFPTLKAPENTVPAAHLSLPR